MYENLLSNRPLVPRRRDAIVFRYDTSRILNRSKRLIYSADK